MNLDVLNMKPKDELSIWKNLSYKESNYDNLSIAYASPLKHLKIKSKTSITLSEGKLHLIINHMNGLQKQEFDIKEDVTLYNDTVKPLFCAVEDCLISDDKVDFSIYVKNGKKDNEIN